MKRLLTAAFVLLSFVVGFSAQATCTSIGCDNEKITRLWVNASGSYYVETAGDISQLNCTPHGGIRMYLDGAKVGAESIYSLLLTAQSMDKPVARIRIIEGSSNCEIAYVYQE